MKRSKIEALIEEALAAFGAHGVVLPPFAAWSPEEWRALGDETLAMRRNLLGWNIAEFTRDDFDRAGIVVFTTRMGDFRDLAKADAGAFTARNSSS